jgi:cytochrome c biogenesis protein CcdA
VFEVKSAGWQPARPSSGWRFGMVWIGLLTLGLGVLVVAFPEIIAYAIGGMLILVGLTIMGSALRMSRAPRSPGASPEEDGSVTVVVEAVEESD